MYELKKKVLVGKTKHYYGFTSLVTPSTPANFAPGTC